MNIKHKVIAASCLLLALSSCKEQQTIPAKEIPATEVLSPKAKTSLLMQENRDFLGNRIQDFHPLTDSTFLVTGSVNNLFVYSDKGEQIGTIGTSGQGAFQYTRPDKCDVDDNTVYVFSRLQQKLFAYDKSGVPITDFSLPCRGIADFAVYQDSLLCCLYDGTEENKTLEVFRLSDMSSLTVVKQKTEEDQLLYLAEKAGGLCIEGDNLFWCTPSSLRLHKLNLKRLDEKPQEWCYSDSEFIVARLEKDACAIINGDRPFVMEYLNSNSRVTQVEAMNNNIYLLAETGAFSTDSDGSFHFEGRKLKIYQIDIVNGNPLHTYELAYPEHCTLVKLTDGCLHLFRATFTDNDMEIWMEKIHL